jgi:glucokinase
LRPVYRFTAPTREFSRIELLLEDFGAKAKQNGHDFGNRGLKGAAFGIAGAVMDGRVVSNNLPWIVDTAAVAQTLGLSSERTVLLNDLVATASSLAHLPPADLLQLNEGTVAQPRAPRALIAAGTGLGEALLFWDGSRYRVFPSEASLTDFAPRNDRELLLVHSLRQRIPRVCCEEIVSGRGFRAIHQIIFPGVHHAFFDEPGDPAAKITQQALAGSCEACEETLHIWMEAYGAEAGNMALRVLPFGGVYIAGGIALRILSKLKDGSFVRAFSDKAKLSTQLAKIPIFVVLNEDAPVWGAAYEALALANA